MKTRSEGKKIALYRYKKMKKNYNRIYIHKVERNI